MAGGHLQVLHPGKYWICRAEFVPDTCFPPAGLVAEVAGGYIEPKMEQKDRLLCFPHLPSDVCFATLPCLLRIKDTDEDEEESSHYVGKLLLEHLTIDRRQHYLHLPFVQHCSSGLL